MARARRAARPEKGERGHFRAPPRAHRANQFEVLEHGAPVVALRRPEHRATHPQGARPVAPKEAVEEHAGRVVAGMPGQGIEVVLWPDDVVAFEEGDDTVEGFRRVADIVVGDHNAFVNREPQAGEDAPDLAHGGYEPRVHRYVSDRRPPERGGVPLEDLGRRAVNNDHLPHVSRQQAQVGPCPLRIFHRPVPDGYYVASHDHSPPPGTRPTATTWPSQA